MLLREEGRRVTLSRSKDELCCAIEEQVEEGLAGFDVDILHELEDEERKELTEKFVGKLLVASVTAAARLLNTSSDLTYLVTS